MALTHFGPLCQCRTFSPGLWWDSARRRWKSSPAFVLCNWFSLGWLSGDCGRHGIESLHFPLQIPHNLLMLLECRKFGLTNQRLCDNPYHKQKLSCGCEICNWSSCLALIGFWVLIGLCFNSQVVRKVFGYTYWVLSIRTTTNMKYSKVAVEESENAVSTKY